MSTSSLIHATIDFVYSVVFDTDSNPAIVKYEPNGMVVIPAALYNM